MMTGSRVSWQASAIFTSTMRSALRIRAHASTGRDYETCESSGGGSLDEKELEYLGRIISNPEHPFVAILGGAKYRTKFPSLTRS